MGTRPERGMGMEAASERGSEAIGMTDIEAQTDGGVLRPITIPEAPQGIGTTDASGALIAGTGADSSSQTCHVHVQWTHVA